MATPHRDSAFTLLTNRHTSRRVELILNLDRSVMNSPTECRVTNDTVPLLDEHRTNVLSLATQHFSETRRQTGVGTDLRGLAVVMTRTVAMLLVAILLILVLLPAALAANGV